MATASPEVSSPWGSASQRATQRRNKREALLATAAGLFRQQGFAVAALDQMARQLGITKPTLYYYVNSKSSLVQACALRGWEQAHSEVQKALPNLNNALEAALRAYARVLESDFGWCMVRVDEYTLAEALRKPLQQQRKALEQCLAAHVPAGAAPMLLRALEGAVLSLPKSQWQLLIATLVRGLQPGNAAPHVVLAARPRQAQVAVSAPPMKTEPLASEASDLSAPPSVPGQTENPCPQPRLPAQQKSSARQPSGAAVADKNKTPEAVAQISLF